MSDQLPPNDQCVANSTAWRQLQHHQQTLVGVHLRDLFAADPQRGQRFTAAAAGIHLDYAKNRITDETLRLLLELARCAGLAAAIERLFTGAEVNLSEHRAALHTALRDDLGEVPAVASQIAAGLAKLSDFADAIRNGNVRGSSGQPFTDVVNLGIGGSDFGPRLVVSAFPQFQGPVNVHFVASIDSGALTEVLAGCRPETTLFLISSKSFSTIETLTNAATAKRWLEDFGITAPALQHHFAAMTHNLAAARQWGVAEERIFPIGEWVGGRFSLWSAIGLPIAIAFGSEVFHRLRAGAHAMDNHFRTAPLAANLPVLLGLLNTWYINFWHSQTRAVLPYMHNLRLLPDYLQQLVMESLGKSVTQHGSPLAIPTGAVIWGSEGTNGQHSFHQLLLQGSHLIPVDFIAVIEPHCEPPAHRQLVAHCLAQSQALMLGKSFAEAEAEALAAGLDAASAAILAHHKTIPGNQPSNTLLLTEFTPATLGALLALYEHSVYTQSVIWNINAFDQWGVELGKRLSTTLAAVLAGASAPADLDSSSLNLLAKFVRAPSKQK